MSHLRYFVKEKINFILLPAQFIDNQYVTSHVTSRHVTHFDT